MKTCSGDLKFPKRDYRYVTEKQSNVITGMLLRNKVFADSFKFIINCIVKICNPKKQTIKYLVFTIQRCIHLFSLKFKTCYLK